MFLCSGLFKFGNRRISNNICLIGIIFLVLISIFRFDVGFDYPTYFKIAEGLREDEIERFEPGNKFIYLIAGLFHWSPLVFIIYGLLTYFFIFDTIWKCSVNRGVSCIVYLSLFYLSSLGVIRQALAVSIIFYSLRFLVHRQFFKYLIFVLLAMMFHMSGVIAIIFYPLYHWFNKKKLAYIIFLGSILSGILLTFILRYTILGIYASYLLKTDELTGGKYIQIFNILLSLLLIISSWKTKNEFSIKLSLISFLGVVLPFIIGSHLGVRMSEYFFISYCLIIPAILKHYSYYIKTISIGFLGIYFMGVLFVSTLNPTKSPYTPYKIVFAEDTKNPNFK